MIISTPVFLSSFFSSMSKQTKIVLASSVLVVVLALGASIYFFKLSQKNPNSVTAEEKAEDGEKLIAKVGALIILPTGEEPVIATVADLKPLEGQLFFARAEIGDRVLIYNEAKRAYLYRPSENKLIEVSSISLTQQ